MALNRQSLVSSLLIFKVSSSLSSLQLGFAAKTRIYAIVDISALTSFLVGETQSNLLVNTSECGVAKTEDINKLVTYHSTPSCYATQLLTHCLPQYFSRAGLRVYQCVGPCRGPRVQHFYFPLSDGRGPFRSVPQRRRSDFSGHGKL